WFAGQNLHGVGRLRIVGPNEIRSLVRGDERSYLLPQAASRSPMAFYRGELIPSLRGDLIVAGGNAPTLTRIRFDSGNPAHIMFMEPLLENAGGVVRTLSVNFEGAIYFCVNDDLMRVVPDRSR